MAISLIQTVAPTPGTGSLVATLSATTIGNLIIVFAGTSNGTTNNVTTITGGTNTFKLASKITGSHIEIWYAVCTQSITSLTIAFAASSVAHVAYVREYSGLATVNSLDISLAAKGNGTAMTTGASDPVNSVGELVVVAAGVSSGVATFTVGAGYGNLVNQNDGAGTFEVAIQDKTATSGPQTGLITANASVGFGVALATFFAAGSVISTKFNNFQHFKVGDGMSTGEKIR